MGAGARTAVRRPSCALYLTTSKGFGAPRFRALYRQWLEDPANTLWIAGSNVLSGACARPAGLDGACAQIRSWQSRDGRRGDDAKLG